MQVSLKKPHAKMFNRLNPVLPFEDATSLEFFSERNDCSLVAVGSNSKKRPNNLVLVRCRRFPAHASMHCCRGACYVACHAPRVARSCSDAVCDRDTCRCARSITTYLT